MPRLARKTRARRTQVERSASTRERLLDATIECLIERGYARTTTTEIARRARLSRGAQLHHFPAKTELVIAAIEYLSQRRIQEFRSAFAELPVGADRAAASVDLLWSIVSNPTSYASMELVMASRTDAQLRRSVAAMEERVTANIGRTFRDLFPRTDEPNPWYELAPAMAFPLMQGLMLWKITAGDVPYLSMTLGALKTLARIALPPTPAGGERTPTNLGLPRKGRLA